MKKASSHPHEQQRLKALENLKLLDTLPESDFDDITLIASQICDAPIALISLVDESRQWFKSKVGLQANETPRDWAFCSHAILQREVFVVPDARQDDRFIDNPLVSGDPHVIFYAGAPLLSPDGFAIGTLCVIDHQPRTLKPEQLLALKALSNQVGRLLQLKTQVAQVNILNQHLEYKKTAIESITEGIVLQDSLGKIIDYNSAALKVLGLSADQLLGKTSLDPSWRAIRSDGSDFSGEQHPAMVALKTGKSQKNIEMGIHQPNFELRWLIVNAEPLFLNSPDQCSHVVASFLDVTELKNMEIQRRNLELRLLETSRLSTLAEMAAGVSHEINNPLAIALGKAESLRMKVQAGQTLKKDSLNQFLKIEEAIHRISKITKGLNDFSRPTNLDVLENVSIVSIIQNTLQLCTEKFKSKQIEIKVDQENDFQLFCRPVEISQVLMNFLNNSFESIQARQERWVSINVRNCGSFACISIEDSGMGIGKEIQEKMMQPFFTTKDVGKGPGLGLSTSKGVVESYGGRIIYDEKSLHTRFMIEIPFNQSLQKTSAA